MKVIDIQEFDNTKLINSIKDEDYRKLVEHNGYCVCLIDIGEAEIKNSYSNKISTRKIKLTEYLGSYRHTWDGESVVREFPKTMKIDIVYKINKSLKLSKHILNGEAVKYMNVYIVNDNEKTVDINIYSSFKKLKLHEPIEAGSLMYFYDTQKTGGLTWHRLYDNFFNISHNWHPAEFWVRLDIENNCGEIYLDIADRVKKLINVLAT